MRSLKNVLMLLVVLTSISLTANGQEPYSIKLDIKSVNAGGIRIEYVQRKNNKYVTTRSESKEINNTWSTLTFTIPEDFKDLKFMFSLKSKDNIIFLKSIYLIRNNNQIPISTEDFIELFATNNIKFNALNKKEIEFNTFAKTSSLRLNITAFKPYILSVNKTPFQLSEFRIKLLTKKDCRVRVYYANSLFKGYPYEKQNYILINIPASNSIETYRSKIASTFDVNLFRIDFEGDDNEIQIYDLIYESKNLKRSWDFTNLLIDFVVATPNSIVEINEDKIRLINHNKYASLVTRVPLKNDSAMTLQKRINFMILMLIIIAAPIFFYLNKKAFSYKKLHLN